MHRHHRYGVVKPNPACYRLHVGGLHRVFSGGGSGKACLARRRQWSLSNRIAVGFLMFSLLPVITGGWHQDGHTVLHEAV